MGRRALSIYGQAVEQAAVAREERAKKVVAFGKRWGRYLASAMIEDALRASGGDYTKYCAQIDSKVTHTGGDDCPGCGEPGFGRYAACERCFVILYGANKFR